MAKHWYDDEIEEFDHGKDPGDENDADANAEQAYDERLMYTLLDVIEEYLETHTKQQLLQTIEDNF